MSEIGRLFTKEAKSHPELHFTVPRDVLGEVMLTRGEKIATLERWRNRVLHQVEVFEGPEKTRIIGDQAQLLDEIEQAKIRLRKDGPE